MSRVIDDADDERIAPQMIRAATAAGVAIGVGLFLDYKIWRPSTFPIAPAFVAADQAERQADEERYERLVTQARLLRLGSEREHSQ